MAIKELIKTLGLTFVAQEVKKHPHTVRRWGDGTHTPRTVEEFRTLYLLSGGRVTPNSFFPISQWEKELSESDKPKNK